MTASPTVCVDIGNSGLRCVLCLPESALRSTQQTTDSVPWSGEVLRIDWLRLRAETASSAASLPDVPTGDLPGQLTDHLFSQIYPWLTRTLQDAALQSAAPANSLEAPQVAQCRWLVSSVQRNAESHLRQCVERIGCLAYHPLTHPDVGLEVAVDQPERVGIDRLLAAYAAAELTESRPLIVIQAGSAITVDWLVAPRRFCGGAIMPGVPMMLRLLSQAADLLPKVAAEELLDLPALPGRNTAAAMKAGACSAVVGGVQHLIARYRTTEHPSALVVLSGGDGPRLAAHLPGPIIEADHLVLRGLASRARAGVGILRPIN